MSSEYGSLVGLLKPGDKIHGHYTFDLNQPDTAPEPDRAVYQFRGLPNNYSITVGNLNFSRPDFDITIRNDAGPTPEDEYVVQFHGWVPGSNFPTGPVLLNGLVLRLSSLGQLVPPDSLTDTILHGAPPDISRFETRENGLLILSDEDEQTIRGASVAFVTVTSLFVPEPTTLLMALFASTIIGHGIRCRR